jgi:hypothetical protein
MILPSGCRFVVAPRFRLLTDLSARLSVGSAEAVGDRFFSGHAWRPPTPDELSLLVGTADEATPAEELTANLCLFRLPDHLRAELWTRLEQAAEALGDANLPGFAAFASGVGEFLAFKGLPLPADARCGLLVSDPGQESVRRDPVTNLPAGLTCNLAPAVPWLRANEPCWPRLWGEINLGDEETSIALIQLPCGELDAELRRRFPERSSPEQVGELVRSFLRDCADCSTIRLLLGPGEGCRLPRGGLISDGYLVGKQEPDLRLSIVCGAPPEASASPS